MNIDELLANNRDHGLPPDYKPVMLRFFSGEYAPPVNEIDQYGNLNQFSILALLYHVGWLARKDPGKLRYAGSKVYYGVAGLDTMCRDVSRDLAAVYGIADPRDLANEHVRFVRAQVHLIKWKMTGYRHEQVEGMIEKEIVRWEGDTPDDKVEDPASMLHWSFKTCLGPHYRDLVQEDDSLHLLLTALKNEVIGNGKTAQRVLGNPAGAAKRRVRTAAS